ncbi:hypothetical protein ACQ4PT_044089 [Festuca glaucescens]
MDVFSLFNFSFSGQSDSHTKVCSRSESEPFLDGGSKLDDITSIPFAGKSYLLNQLFGANFPVMDKKQGWQQTTKGILMSRTVGPSLLILDVEGFDGKERGEDRKFENQAALFALTYRTS